MGGKLRQLLPFRSKQRKNLRMCDEDWRLKQKKGSYIYTHSKPKAAGQRLFQHNSRASRYFIQERYLRRKKKGAL